MLLPSNNRHPKSLFRPNLSQHWKSINQGCKTDGIIGEIIIGDKTGQGQQILFFCGMGRDANLKDQRDGTGHVPSLLHPWFQQPTTSTAEIDMFSEENICKNISSASFPGTTNGQFKMPTEVRNQIYFLLINININVSKRKLKKHQEELKRLH